MLEKLSLSELGIWAALWRQSPWDENRADLRTAIIASVIANVNRDTKKKSEPFRPFDFMPYAERDAQEDQLDLSKRLRAALTLAGKKPK